MGRVSNTHHEALSLLESGARDTKSSSIWVAPAPHSLVPMGASKKRACRGARGLASTRPSAPGSSSLGSSQRHRLVPTGLGQDWA